MAKSAASLATRVPWPAGRLAFQSLESKLAVFQDYDLALEILLGDIGKSASDRDSVKAALSGDLNQWIGRARRYDPYRAFWLLEGLGRRYARHAAEEPSGALLLPHDIEDASAYLPLHLGMGLYLAERFLGEASAAPRKQADDPRPRPMPEPASRLEASFNDLRELCRAYSRPGYFEAAFEPLGMVARLLFPQTLNPLDRLLASEDPNLRACFWHGVGRGLYFAPSLTLPWLAWQSRNLGRVYRPIAEDPRGRNLLAGLSKALVLVNIRHPAVVADFLDRNHGWPCFKAAFSQGVATALVAWPLATESPEEARRFIQHRPSDRALRQLWKEHVRQPAQRAVSELEPRIRRRDAPGELFRFHPLTDASRQRWFPSAN
ncbi:MAG TPA: hypothetical protein VLV83_16350 [Acidobacteriota bacterium]|nr:hypothetical protein [Acidobacteriota bacterium]